MADLRTQLQQIIDRAVSDAQSLVSRMVRESVEQALTGKGRKATRVARSDGATRPRRGKRVRRSAEELKAAAQKVTSAVKAHKGGVSAEALQKQTKMPREELARALHDALKAKMVHKRGKKRATKYFP